MPSAFPSPSSRESATTGLWVQIPDGIRDVERAKNLIGATAQLEFREQDRKEDGTFVTDPQTGSILWKPALASNDNGQMVPLTGEFMLPTAQVVLDPSTNLPDVAFEFNGEGARMFQSITSRLLNQPLGIFLDGQLISSPTVQAVISSNGVITGLTLDEADDLAIELNAGALPVPIELIREQDVDATLGAESVNKSMIAGIVGLLLVLAFLMVYYKLPGVLSGGRSHRIRAGRPFHLQVVARDLSPCPVWRASSSQSAWPWTQTSSYSKGLRKSYALGVVLRVAVEAGFNRAWDAIRDSNVSTLITCAILWWFGDKLGTPLVTGFAITLAIGVVTSMFSAMFVTRSFLRFVVGARAQENPGLFGLSTSSSGSAQTSTQRRGLNLVGKRFWFFCNLGDCAPSRRCLAHIPACIQHGHRVLQRLHHRGALHQPRRPIEAQGWRGDYPGRP